ncbi:hypothetical protein Zmor_008212 [Zophobas morio]|uniref:Uncharacterized protein n=1 Tax=Zophobas morio TaxID=2755281 RepID=A0AA38IW07_9CUCU|nr:hypothetical protein Zmor_008212 [Zophobas morio]
MQALRNLARRLSLRNSSKPIQNCVVCIFFQTLLIGHFVSPIIGHCKHSKYTFSDTQFFAISKISLGLDIVFFLAFTGATFSYTYELSTECRNVKEKISCFQSWGDQMFALNGLICTLLFLGKIRKRVTDLNSWAWISENCQKFGIKHVLCRHCTKHLMKRNLFMIGWLVMINVFFICTYIWLSTKEALSYARKASIFMSAVVQFDIHFEYLQQTLLLYYIGKSLKKSVVRKFTERCEGGTESLEDTIKEYVRFWLTYNDAHKFMTRLINPLPTVWIFFDVVILIINFYLMVMGSVFGVFQVRTAVIIVALVVLIHFVQSEYETVSILFIIV